MIFTTKEIEKSAAFWMAIQKKAESYRSETLIFEDQKPIAPRSKAFLNGNKKD